MTNIDSVLAKGGVPQQVAARDQAKIKETFGGREKYSEIKTTPIVERIRKIDSPGTPIGLSLASMLFSSPELGSHEKESAFVVFSSLLNEQDENSVISDSLTLPKSDIEGQIILKMPEWFKISEPDKKGNVKISLTDTGIDFVGIRFAEAR